MIPLPLLFGKPEKAQLRISPCEKWLAWTARDTGGVLNIWVQRRDSTSAPRQITFQEERDACHFFTFTADDRTLLYLDEPSHGSEFYHLYACDLDTASPNCRDLIDDPKVTVVMGFVGNVQLWMPPDSPREVLLASGRGSLFWEISRLNIDTGERSVIASNPMSTKCGILTFGLRTLCASALRCLTCGCVRLEPPRAPVFWFPDRQFSFRGRAEVSLEGLTLYVHFSVLQRNGRWRSIEKVPFKEINKQLIGAGGGGGTMRMDFSEDGQSLVVHSQLANDTTSLVRYDVDTGQRRVVVANAADSDITGFISDPLTRAVQVVEFNGERPRWQVLDTAVSADLAFLEGKFPGLTLAVMPRPRSDRTWVVHLSGDTEPGAYYLYDRDAQKLTEVFRPRPALRNHGLGMMHPAWVDTRDGERLLCYLSLPHGETVVDRARPLPLVLYIHGGPNARDDWGFDNACHLLTSRGMAVLQVNYRGSTGLGARWTTLGMQGAFSGAAQHDVEDAAGWAVSMGIADASRLAILGASFGGYAALFHLTLGSLELCAGVAICAVSAVGKAGSMGFRGDPLVAQYWKDVYGAAAHDVAAARAASPVFHLDRLRAPVLVLHGDRDPRVPREQSDTVAAAVRRQGVGGSYVTYADEGHGVRREPNVLDMWARVEQFLCRELQLQEPPAVVPASGSTATVHWEEESRRTRCR